MIKPGALHTASEAMMHHAAGDGGGSHAGDALAHAEHAAAVVAGFNYPSLLEIGTFLGIFGTLRFCSFYQSFQGCTHTEERSIYW